MTERSESPNKPCVLEVLDRDMQHAEADIPEKEMFSAKDYIEELDVNSECYGPCCDYAYEREQREFAEFAIIELRAENERLRAALAKFQGDSPDVER